MIKKAAQTFSFEPLAKVLFDNRKKAGIYGLLFIIIAFNLCLFLESNMHSPGRQIIVTIVQLTCFAFMGIINVWILYKRNFLAELSLSGAKLAFICLLFIAMALVLFIYYYISGYNDLVMAFASSGAFFLPFVVYNSFIVFMDIPSKNYPLWYLPDSDTPVINTTNNPMLVQLQIARCANDKETHTYPATISAKTKLGKLFETLVATHSMSGKKTGIQIKNKQDQFYGWQFCEERWFGFYKRWLDPSVSLAANKIGPNAKITIIRVGAEN